MTIEIFGDFALQFIPESGDKEAEVTLDLGSIGWQFVRHLFDGADKALRRFLQFWRFFECRNHKQIKSDFAARIASLRMSPLYSHHTTDSMKAERACQLFRNIGWHDMPPAVSMQEILKYFPGNGQHASRIARFSISIESRKSAIRSLLIGNSCQSTATGDYSLHRFQWQEADIVYQLPAKIDDTFC